MLIESINRFKTNLRRYSFIWISILVGAIFIYPPFFDNFNLAGWVNSMTLLTNNFPAYHNTSFPGGPFFLSIFVPVGYFYIFTGYSLYHTAILLKVILLMFTTLTGYLTYKIVERIDPKYSKFSFLFVMINPATIYVNYIWTQLDILPIFFTLLSFYAVYYTDYEERTFLTQLLLLTPLFIAIFTYYYPLLLIPSFIIYSKTIRTSITKLSCFVLLGAVFLAIDIFQFGAFSLSTVSSLAPTVSTKYFQGLQSVIIIPEPLYILILVMISIFVPIITKKTKMSIYVSGYIIILSLLYISTKAITDNFLWILPFSILVIMELKTLRRKKGFVLLSNIFLFTGILFINFYVGTGTQAGIFYFGYELFHYNYLFIRSLSAFDLYVQIYFIFLTFSFIISIFIIVLFNLKPFKLSENEIKKENLPRFIISKKRIKINRVFKFKFYRKFLRLSKTLIALCLVIVLVYGGFQFNSTAFSNIEYNGSGSPPIYYFAPSYGSGNFAMPINNLTYVLEGSSIDFSNKSPSICLSRNVQKEFINLSMNERINTNSIQNIPLIRTNLFSVNLLSSLEINNSKGASIKTLDPVNLSSKSVSINNLTNSIDVYNVSLNNSFKYRFNNLSEQRSLFYKVNSIIPPYSSFNQTVLFYLSLGSFTFHLVIYNKTGLLVFHDEPKQCSVIPFSYQPFDRGWDLLTFSIVNESFKFAFNNFSYMVKIPTNNMNNDEFVCIGTSSGLGATHSFTGEVSKMYNSSHFSYYKHFKILVKSKGTKSAFNASTSNISIDVRDDNIKTELKVNNNTIAFDSLMSQISFGKLANYTYKIDIEVNEIKITNHEVQSYYFIPVYVAFLLPYLITFLSLIYLRRQNIGK